MKKQRFPVSIGISLVFLCLTIGVFIGRNLNRSVVLVSVPEEMQTLPPEETRAVVPFPIDLNTAKKEDLLALPGIGDVLALRIYAYRLERGKLQSVEELYAVEGIGEETMKKIKGLVYVGGAK